MGLFKNIFGANAYSNRELKRIDPIKNKVLELDEEYQQLSDAELKGKTAEFKDRLEDGETLAQAALRETSEETGLITALLKSRERLLQVPDFPSL